MVIKGRLDNPRLYNVNLYQTIILDYNALSCCPHFPDVLGQKETELGNEGCPSGISGPPLQKSAGRGDSKSNLPKRVRFSGLDSPSGGASNVRPERDESCGLFANEEVARVPTYDEVCRSLAHHLAFTSGTTFREWVNFLFSLREAAPGTNALRSRHFTCPLPDGLL